MEPTIIQLPAIDAEHDIVPEVAVVTDYNGCPIVHVFIMGERVLRMDPVEGDWSFEWTLCTTSDERQAYAALAYHLGELSEDQDQLLADVWGDFMGRSEADTFDEVTSHIDGHLMVAWAGTVAQAVYALDPDYLPEPTGW